jgi:hypothetical protein
MNYRSVMVFGVAHVIEDLDEKRRSIQALVEPFGLCALEAANWPHTDLQRKKKGRHFAGPFSAQKHLQNCFTQLGTEPPE